MKTTTMGILRYILLILSSLFITVAFAQNEDDAWNVTAQKTFYGFSVYADAAGPVSSMFKDGKTDFSFGVDADICHTIFPTFEAGYSKYDATESYNYGVQQANGYTYICSGSYYKIGANFNFLNDGRGKKVIPLLYIGAKFAFSPSHFEINNVRLQNVFWGIDDVCSVSGKGLCRWAEFSAGLRYPIVKFFFMGIEGKMRQFGGAKEKSCETENGLTINVNQSYSPGFGNFNGSKWAVKYTLGYFFH